MPIDSADNPASRSRSGEHGHFPASSSGHALGSAFGAASGSAIRLEAIAGPHMDPIGISDHHATVFGRSSACDKQLADKTVSRRHCRVTRRGDGWFIADLDSRHGTYLNGVRLSPEQPAPLVDGDLVRIGPWTFRVREGAGRGTAMPTTNDLATTSHRVQRVPVRELRSMAEQRLDLILECAEAINAASEVTDLAERVLDAVCQGTGFARAAFIRQVSAAGEVEVIAARIDNEPATRDGGPVPFEFSRSLITAAADGEIVRMQSGAGLNYGESIIRLGISSALCAPVMLGGAVEAYVYLDARGSTNTAQADAAAFCQAIARLAGLALGNVKRLALEKAQTIIAGDLRAARQAQRLIMPGATGRVGPLRYALQTKPGRHVAGDLFDVVPLGDPGDPLAPVGVFLGDVSGKGAGAAILMATAQTHLRMALRHYGDAAAAVRDANAYLAAHIDDKSFISLWLGIIDPRAQTVSFVDAGHGHWLMVDPAGRAGYVECRGGLLLAIRDDTPYEAETIPFPPGSRLVLFSDGLVEQPDPDGVQFGHDRIREEVSGNNDAEVDVRRLVDSVRRFADTDTIADDLTVACVQFAG